MPACLAHRRRGFHRAGLHWCERVWSLTLFFVLKDPFLSHSFGMVHDGEGNVCKKSEGNIMSPTLAGRNGLFSWSACSRQYLHRFLRCEPCSCLWGPQGLSCSRLGPPSPVGAVPRLRCSRRSPPVVRPGSQAAAERERSAAGGLGTPVIKEMQRACFLIFKMLAGRKQE